MADNPQQTTETQWPWSFLDGDGKRTPASILLMKFHNGFKYVFFSFFIFLQLLCLVGESFDEASDDVCGAVVNVRPKGDKIAIWTSNCQNRDAIMTIG